MRLAAIALVVVAAAPDEVGLRCWLYAVTDGHEGRRVCFTSGRVTTLQFSAHG